MILQGIVISTNVVTLKLQDLARLQTISSSPLSSLFPQGVADVHGQSDQADSLIFDSRVELKSLMRTADAVQRELTGGGAGDGSSCRRQRGGMGSWM